MLDYVNGKFIIDKEDLDNSKIEEILEIYSGNMNSAGEITLPVDTPDYLLTELYKDNVDNTSAEAMQELNKRWHRLIVLDDIKSRDDIELDRVSPKLNGYQKVGAKFLAEAGRAILGDYMGLGKSSEAIGACDYIGAQRVLIVCKKSLETNWIKEIEKFSVGEKEYQILGSRSEVLGKRFTVVSYETLMRRWENVGIDDMEFEVMVIDEASKILNRKSKRSKATKAVARKCKYVWILSGTLIRNKPDEIWSLLSCLYPNVYTSYWRFRKRNFIERTIFGRDGKPLTTEIVGLRDAEKFRHEIEPYILRRGREMLKLPSITYQTLYVDMNPVQRKMYLQMENDLVAELEQGNIIAAPTELAKYTRLRQLCIDARLCGGTEVGGKTEAIHDFVEDMADDYKIIIFSTFTEYLKILCKELKKYNPVMLVGGMTVKQRDESMDRFQNDPECRIFLGNIDAAGEGLNITAGDIILFANCPWTPDIIAQGVARAHRMGREGAVHVFFMQAIDTIEEYIDDILKEKEGYYSEIEAIREAVRKRRYKNKA